VSGIVDSNKGTFFCTGPTIILNPKFKSKMGHTPLGPLNIGSQIVFSNRKRERNQIEHIAFRLVLIPAIDLSASKGKVRTCISAKLSHITGGGSLQKLRIVYAR